MPLIIRRLIAPLTVAVVVCHAGQAGAQGAFPAPLPNQSAPPANASPFPPVGGAPAQASPFPPAGGGAAAPGAFPSQGAAPMQGAGFGGPPPQGPSSGPSDACMKGFMPLREEA